MEDKLKELQNEIEKLKDQNARILEINQGLCIENTELKCNQYTQEEYDKMMSKLAEYEKLFNPVETFGVIGDGGKHWLNGFSFLELDSEKHIWIIENDFHDQVYYGVINSNVFAHELFKSIGLYEFSELVIE